MLWKNWCRLCGSMKEPDINVFIKTEHFLNIADAILKLLSINISETDDISTKICHECNKIFNSLIDFYVQCNKIQQMYTEILNLQNKIDLNDIRVKYKLVIDSNESNNENCGKHKNISIEQNNSYKTTFNSDQSTNLILNGNIESVTVRNCNIFPENFYKSTKNIKSKVINCEICKKIFTSNRGYGIHLKIKHSINRNPIECKFCGKSFKIMTLLKKHENTHLPTDKKKFYQCKKCNKKFSSDSGLWSHTHTVHEQNRSVICEECGKEFPTQSYLQSHKLSHKKENNFQCPKCPMKLKRQKTLTIHLQTHGENFICPICGIQLNTKKTLREHMVVHSDEKKFKCNLCNKCFKREKTLNSHLILHTGLKPYECEFCKKRFTHGSNFRTHQKNIHPIELAEREAKGEKHICKEFPKVKLLKELNKNK